MLSGFCDDAGLHGDRQRTPFRPPLSALVTDEARAEGAEIVEAAPGAVPDPTTRRFRRCCVASMRRMRVMQERSSDRCCRLFRMATSRRRSTTSMRPRPLALYYFDTDASAIATVPTRTVSGGVTINDTPCTSRRTICPSAASVRAGWAAITAVEGFRTFSAKKGVFRQSWLSGIGVQRLTAGALRAADPFAAR